MNIIEKFKKQFNESDLARNPDFQKYKQFIVPIVVIIIAILIAVLVTIPQFVNLFNTFKTIDELKGKQTFYQTKITDLSAVKIEDYKKNLDTALVALPVDKDIPGVLGEILVALGGSGMSLDSITFSNGSGDGRNISEFGINIKATGSEANLKNFLERVTLTPRLIKLSGIEVSGGLNNEVSASFNFATFYQILPAGKTAADEPLPKISQDETKILTDIENKLRQFPSAQTGIGSTTTGKIDPFSP